MINLFPSSLKGGSWSEGKYPWLVRRIGMRRMGLSMFFLFNDAVEVII